MAHSALDTTTVQTRAARISAHLYAEAGVSGRFADPRELVYAAGYSLAPLTGGDAPIPPNTIVYRWSADRRERGLNIFTALAAKLAPDDPALSSYLAAPPTFALTMGLSLTLLLQQHAPGWFLRAWFRHLQRFGSIYGAEAAVAPVGDRREVLGGGEVV